MSKKAKTSPPYWRLHFLLKRLMLEFSERDKNTNTYHVLVPAFGTVFRFNRVFPSEAQYPGWDFFDVSTKELEVNDKELGEQLLWSLIGKGYFSYLRESYAGMALFNKLLNDGGWARKIIDKRLESWNNQPRYKYRIEQHKRLKASPIKFVLMHYPDFFDFLV